jgi:hypothetical protein
VGGIQRLQPDRGYCRQIEFQLLNAFSGDEVQAWRFRPLTISGLGMGDWTWTVESIPPFVLTAIEAFGVDRCMTMRCGTTGSDVRRARVQAIRGGSCCYSIRLLSSPGRPASEVWVAPRPARRRCGNPGCERRRCPRRGGIAGNGVRQVRCQCDLQVRLLESGRVHTRDTRPYRRPRGSHCFENEMSKA